MRSLDRSARAQAAVLAALAGYVDVVGFLGSAGFFLSFMSGNSTRLSVGLVEGAPWVALPAMIILAFVAGVTVATLVGRGAPSHRRRSLLLVALLLALGAALAGAGQVFPALLLVAAAMGAENIVFAETGDVRFGLTYMTGTLVRLGQKIAEALAGGADRWAFLPLVAHWAALVAGAVLGALLWGWLGFAALWPASAIVLLLAALARPGQR